MSVSRLIDEGHDALRAGRWEEARRAFASALVDADRGDARLGSAIASWWLGDNHDSVAQCTRAYALFRDAGEVASAVQCAVWLSITYKANFANHPVANGWLGRAERLLETEPPGPLHGWVRVARAYRLTDLDRAVHLAQEAIELARAVGDVELELVALSQLGLSRVGRGETEAGFALIDEALAAALAGEGSSLDAVVYACCDMLNACEIVADLERAAQWCRVADDFVETYGCPFLYAECRILYGSVLVVKGRWDDAERELRVGLRITEGACPGLHGRATVRLAGLRVRQGRLEDAEGLITRLGDNIEDQREAAVTTAALLLARGDAPGACRTLEQRLRLLAEHRTNLVAGLDLLVDAQIATDDLGAASATSQRLSAVASATDNDALRAAAAAARGRVAGSRGELEAALADLEVALTLWARLEVPYEVARAHLALAGALSGSAADAAVEHARRALSGFEALGAARDADEAAAFLRAHGVVPRTGPKRLGVLTAREQEVLALLAVGLTNPEIAARLHVSRKTASHHVSNILAKLNLRNRAEVAAYAAAAVEPTSGRSSGPR